MPSRSRKEARGLGHPGRGGESSGAAGLVQMGPMRMGRSLDPILSGKESHRRVLTRTIPRHTLCLWKIPLGRKALWAGGLEPERPVGTPLIPPGEKAAD